MVQLHGQQSCQRGDSILENHRSRLRANNANLEREKAWTNRSALRLHDASSKRDAQSTFLEHEGSLIASEDKNNILSHTLTALQPLVISISGNAAGVGDSVLRSGLALT